MVLTNHGGFMKNLNAILLILSLAASLLVTNQATAKDVDCMIIKEVARMAMELRQAGHLVNTGNELADTFIEYAWKQPRYQSERMIQQSIEEFSALAYFACMDANRGDYK